MAVRPLAGLALCAGVDGIELDTIEKIGLMTELRAVIDHRQDSVVFIDLGEPGRRNAARVQFTGTPLTLASGGPTIV